ncbi:MAG: hypothetical protein HC843_05305 [Sphingomonadales bacterium]|nr:hypothetical protein [Sphingomonadales bacterium]
MSDAIRQDNATARTRQNLALAYALNGRWREARIMAVQDMPQDRVNDRITEWAQYARPGAYETRIAGLLKVTPQSDAGQPVRLALANAPAALASAAPVAPAQSLAEEASEELAAIGPAPVAMVKGFDAPEEKNVAVVAASKPAPIQPIEIPASDNAPLIKAPVGPSKAAAVQPAAKAKEPAKLALADVAPKAPATRNVSGTHLVQLGAFSTTENAKKAWEN